jgi:DNA polymerase-3 subunit alpha
MGIVNLSDPSGQFEAVLFSEGLQRHRDLLEPGRALVLRLSAVLDGEEVRPRIEDVEVLDDLASRQKQDLLIYLRDEKAVPSIAERIRPREAMRAEGKVSIVMILDDGAQEVEIELPGKFPVNQQIANAVRAAPGVVSVEMR